MTQPLPFEDEASMKVSGAKEREKYLEHQELAFGVSEALIQVTPIWMSWLLGLDSNQQPSG